MPLNIGGVDPLTVKCKQGQTEVSLDAIKVGSDYVWSRHIPLTYTGTNATYTINRKTSPWHHGNVGTVTVLRYKDTYQLKITPATNYYIYDYTINGTSQIANGRHFITGARTSGVLTASGTEIKVTVTAKRLYTLTWPKLANSYFHTTVYGYRNSTDGTKNTILTAGTTEKTATIFEDEEIWYEQSVDYTCYTLVYRFLPTPGFANRWSVSEDVSPGVSCREAKNWKTVWSGDRHTGWIRNSSATQKFFQSDGDEFNGVIFKNGGVSSPNGYRWYIHCVSWMSFGTKKNQTAYSGDKTLTNTNGWSGHLKHASWTGSFSMNMNISGGTGTVTFKGSDMGAYYAKGYIKSWAGLYYQEI